jgi:hypothetical protein
MASERLREWIGAHFTWAAPCVGECFGEYPTWNQLTDEDKAHGLARADDILFGIAQEYALVPMELVEAYVTCEGDCTEEFAAMHAVLEPAWVAWYDAKEGDDAQSV